MSKVFTREEVAEHNTVEDFYTIVGDYVYDMTKYVHIHPGGYQLLFKNAGKDSTKDFDAMFHSMKARKLLEDYIVGKLDSSSANSMTSLTPNYLTRFANSNNIMSGGYPPRSNLQVSNPYSNLKQQRPVMPQFSNSTKVNGHSFKVPQINSTAPEAEEEILSEKKFKKFKLVKVNNMTYNTKVFVFELPNNKKVNLPPGQHIQVCVVVSQERVVRKYTPITDELGRLEIMIKKYEQGVVSRQIFDMSVGDKIFLRGPFGGYKYSQNVHKDIVMIAAGTGIAPMYQIIKCIHNNPADTTNIKLLFANRSEDDILLKKELDQMSGNRLSVLYLLSQPINPVYEHAGRINENLFKNHVEANSMVMICGPDGFCDLSREILNKMNHDQKLIHVF
ncbi:cytochrome-b5 reductase [Acrasis kona]|uniref:cytochrome-b5 reductase n=1 Tax=Acrasis kona TaxID=1008807 RepID=A0AAW2YX89_9EUKA